MSELRILFVDDDAAQRDLFQDAVSDWNAGSAPRTFVPIVLGTVAEARAALAFQRFDCALFDLKFKAENGVGDRLTGNELARIGIEDNGIPVGIISGDPGDLEPALAARGLLTPFVKRPDACARAVEWFGTLWEMMEVLSAARLKIRRAEADIFLRRLWDQWAQYAALPHVDRSQLETIVTRQFAGHIAEMLGTDGDGNPDWHPFECYIRPSLRNDRPQTGDIFRRGEDLWIVLTPACDMANAKVDTVLLALCSSHLPAQWADKLVRLGDQLKAGEVSNSVRDFFRDQTTQKIEGSKHFLPPLDGRLVMVDFQRLETVPMETLKSALGDRIASVSTPFIANLVQRFGSHLSRPGQPNIDYRFFAGA